MSKKNEQKERKRNTCIQISRLENLEQLELHHNHEKFLFLTVLLSLHNAKCIIGD
jgi:hypothetical protein